MPTPQLHLASSSPRRTEILTALGLEFTAAGVDIDEQRRPDEPPDAMVLRLAEEKARAADAAATLILGADTAVVLGDLVFGKPRDQADALAMLQQLSGRQHQVMTGVAVLAGGHIRSSLSVSEVQFREIRPDEARSYWQSGEPRDKAGAYAIQGLGGVFVESIRGSYSGVVGLPTFETAELLQQAGLEILRG